MAVKKCILIFTIFLFSLAFANNIVNSENYQTKQQNKTIDSIDWKPYLADLEQRIKRNWHPTKENSSKTVVIAMTIAKDGRLLSHKIIKSSGVPLADTAAMSTIEATAPFRPLPPEFKGQSVPIEFTFKYSVFNTVNSNTISNIKLSSDSNGEIYIEQAKKVDELPKKLNWGPYMRNIENKIKSNWNPPKNETSKRVTAQFEINRNGELLGCKIVKSSNEEIIDNAAISAIKKSAPFEPLPENFKGNSVPIEFTFDYNVKYSVSNTSGNKSPYKDHVINTYYMLSH